MEEPKTWLVPKEQEGSVEAVAQHIKATVKLKAETELEMGASPIQDAPWFIEKHLEVVEDRMDWILANSEEARDVDRNEALIGVWTHDLARLMGWDESHHAAGALKTKQWLLDNGLSEEVANRVFNMNLKHRAKGNYHPEMPIEKVLASADALSHFDGCEAGNIEGFLEREGFWFQLWKGMISKDLSNEQILERSIKKMERDATSKQHFAESRERAQSEFEFLRSNAPEILQKMRQELAVTQK